MNDILSSMDTIMPQEAYTEIAVTLGIELQWNNHILSPAFSYIYLIGFTLILLGFVIVQNRKKR